MALTSAPLAVALEAWVALTDVLRGQVDAAGVPVTVVAQRTEISP